MSQENEATETKRETEREERGEGRIAKERRTTE
jgi:hypothetical protein